MNGDVRFSGFAPTASRRELTVYDAPEKRSPEDEARDRAKHVESHPFLYYLGQMVPGLQQNQPPEATGDVSSGAASAIGAAGTLAGQGLGVWGREAANRMFDGSAAARPLAAEAAEPVDPTRAVPIFPAQVAAMQPVAPVQEVEAAAPVAPVEIPRIVMAQVDRMVQNGVPASTLHVKLDPPNLGKVELAFTYAQQKVSVNIMAATQQARDHLETQLMHIRSILHAHNLPTGELKVVLASQSAGPQGGGSDKEPGDQPARYRRRRRSNPLDEAISGI